jgi:hypothetical protein
LAKKWHQNVFSQSNKRFHFAPLSSIRQTPRRNRSSIQNYSQYERIDEPIQNPPRTPKTTTHNTQAEEEEDVEMADKDQDSEQECGSPSSEEIEVQPSETPTRQNLPTTITIKKRFRNKKPRKQRGETTWTQAYFDITLIDETWVNEVTTNKPVLNNRLWICKLCGPAFSSTDKERHGNTSKLNNHLRDEHDMNKQKHQLGILPKQKGGKRQEGAMNKFIQPIEAIPTAEEAVLQVFALTNQSFELVEHQGFKNLYRSVGTTCPINSANVLYIRQEARFNASRQELKVEFDETCETFSFSFDGWGANNHIHILGVIAHWITANWERRSIVIEFAEMVGGKSGQAMAELIWETIGPESGRRTTKKLLNKSMVALLRSQQRTV